jgi:hypothetical protein
MGARAEQGPAFDSHELDALQFDLQDVLVGSIFDAAFRIARSACCVNGYRESRGSRDFVDSTGLPYRLVHSFDGRRLVLELQYDESMDAIEALQLAHARV